MSPTDVPNPTPHTDVSVRLAWPDDATAIVGIQIEAWRAGGLLPDDLLDKLHPDELAEVWRTSISRPRDARQRVLVALERQNVRGFAAVTPSTDPDADPVSDAELSELEVSAVARGAGHGSRLLHAVVDTLRSDKFTRATTWLNASDDELRTFFTHAGWAPDGAHRELDLRADGEVLVRQVRLHTDLRRD